MKVLDERPHRIAPDGRAADLDARLRPAAAAARRRGRDRCAARAVRGRVRPRLPRRGRERRLQPPGRRGAPAGDAKSSILRAYAKYLRQIGFALSQAFIETTLAAHAGHRRASSSTLFKLRFDPGAGGGCATRRSAQQVRAIEAALDKVDNLVRGPRAAPVPRADHGDDAHQLLAPRRDGRAASASCRSSSIRRRCPACRSRSRCSRSSSTRRASKACTCAAARSRAAACAGRTGRRISAPRCWASSRRRW